MPPASLLRKTYSTLSAPLPPSNDSPGGSVKEIVVHPSESSPRTIPRHSFLIRVIIFVLLESGFIVLVSAALHKPIFLHGSLTNSEVKGAATVIAIVWHALAVYVVKDILLNIFSAEWTEQYDESRNLTLQELDIVSRLTTGLIDQAKHCISRRATPQFRLGFVSFLLLMLLNGLGPSAIGVDLVPYDYPSTTQVANLTLGAPGMSNDSFPFSNHAKAIVQLEVVDNAATVGFHTAEPSILIPWPSSDLMSENMTMRYESDVIRFNFSCSWKMLSPLSSPFPLAIDVDDEWFLEGVDKLDAEAVYPLERVDSRKVSPLVSFLFVGWNQTPSPLTLKGLPSLTLPCNATYNPASWGTTDELNCSPLVVSHLVCDPHLEVLPATINATTNFLEATVLPGAPTVKNIPIEAANYLFATSLLMVDSDILGIALPVFLSKGASGLNHHAPLPLNKINQNLNIALASSAKAYLNGYQPNDTDLSLPNFAMVNTSAMIETQKLALVGREAFFVASSVTVGFLVIFVGAIVVITRSDQLESFELEYIVRKLS